MRTLQESFDFWSWLNDTMARDSSQYAGNEAQLKGGKDTPAAKPVRWSGRLPDCVLVSSHLGQVLLSWTYLNSSFPPFVSTQAAKPASKGGFFNK